MNKHNELIAKEGWVFFFPLVILTLICGFLGYVGLTIFVGILAVYVAYFFRNPYRQIPSEPGAIVSPGDGKVVAVRTLDDGTQAISIFLNIFNVHVNRSPIEGTIDEVEYTHGKFVPADREDASHINERNKLVISDGDFRMEVTQVAGLIARRIVCWSKQGQTLARGERFGLIRFGSRVDMRLIGDCKILVRVGQKVAGGSDIIAQRPV